MTKDQLEYEYRREFANMWAGASAFNYCSASRFDRRY